MSVPRISRRTLLRGFGAAIALPLLDAMPAASLWADQGAKSLPRRMGFVFVPNGMHMPAWTPKTEGEDFELTSILEPLAKHRQYLNVLSGLAQDKARAHGDGGGDHARSMATFLTGCQARKTNGADIKIGVSVDQIAAERIGERTQLSSLELGCAPGAQSGNCDSGYSCAYSSNLSWRSESTPMPKEMNPRLVFERMFGGGEDAKGRARRVQYQHSVLDFVMDDARRLQGQVGAKDRRKLDEYFTSLREVEKRIQRAEVNKERQPPEFPAPAGVPKSYIEHVRLMYDLMALAYQADVTRVVTFALDNEGSTRSYSFINVPEGHHDLSHHGRDPNKQEKIRQINRFHAEQFAYFIDKLASTPEGPGSLLDNCMIVYGSGIGDGDRHNHDDLPIALLGRGGGSIRSGRHVLYKKETPLNNLYLAMLDRMEATTERLGDSNGKLELS
jgi:hypothetical protein